MGNTWPRWCLVTPLVGWVSTPPGGSPVGGDSIGLIHSEIQILRVRIPVVGAVWGPLTVILKAVCASLLAQHGSKVVWKSSCGTWVGSSLSQEWLLCCGGTKQSISKHAAVAWLEMVEIGSFWDLREGRGKRGKNCNAISCCWLYFHHTRLN